MWFYGKLISIGNECISFMKTSYTHYKSTELSQGKNAWNYLNNYYGFENQKDSRLVNEIILQKLFTKLRILTNRNLCYLRYKI